MIKNVQTYDCKECGFDIDTADSFIDSCDAALSGKQGFYIKGSSIRACHSKAWYSGQVDATKGFGWHIIGNRFQASNIEAQENYNHGFYLNNVSNIVLEGCTADANGYNFTTSTILNNGSGFFLDGVTRSRINGISTSFHGSVNIKQNYAFSIGGYARENVIDITTLNQGAKVDINTRYNSDNDIIIRNEDSYNAVIIENFKREQRKITSNMALVTNDWVRIAKVPTLNPMTSFTLSLALYRNVIGSHVMTVQFNVPMNFANATTIEVSSSPQALMCDAFRLVEENNETYLEFRYCAVDNTNVTVTYQTLDGTYMFGNHKLQLLPSVVSTTGTQRKILPTTKFGATVGRPSTLGTVDTGFAWFDTTINKPIWWSGSSWRDANGATV